MLTGLSALANDARAWPFEQARAMLTRVLNVRLDDKAAREAALALIVRGRTDEALRDHPSLQAPVVMQTGYGASGLPHIGTFNEVQRTTMVRSAFRALTEEAWPTRLIVFSDDMDGMRKVPDNVPNKAMLAEDLGRPLTAVRDPFGEQPSFGDYNNVRMRAFLDGFGFEYDFISSTQVYRSGRFDDVLLTMLRRFDDVQAIMLPTLGAERRATYSPFLPISPTSGRVLLAPTLERDPERGTIVFEDEDGSRVETAVTGGRVKIQWKPDWAVRWAGLSVDYEMSGKDHIDNIKVSSRICRVLGGTPPEGMIYELFLDADGGKISKSKGNGLTLEDWLRYGPPESLSYYIFGNPKSAKKLHFDVIPRAVDDYLQHIDAFNAPPPTIEKIRSEDLDPELIELPELIEVTTRRLSARQKLDNPVWAVHGGAPPAQGSPVSFALLLNLVGVANATDKAMLWAFISRYLPGATPESEPLLDRLAEYALQYYRDFVLPAKVYRAPTDVERAAMLDLAARLRALPTDTRDGETVQAEVYAAGKAAGFDPLRLWFQALYEVLLGSSQGPRFGSFAAIYGLPETLALIDRALAGDLLTATAA